MNIAILGATSQIAKDLVLSLSKSKDYALTLFARRPELVDEWLSSVGLADRFSANFFNAFQNSLNFDVVINFVGVGNPALALNMGNSIFDITYEFDGLALAYLNSHPECRYIFLSSGSAYGDSFNEPVNQDSRSRIPLNDFKPQDYYSLAKLHAEARHRALPNRAIIDIRVFNYISHTQDLDARFLISDIFRNIKSGGLLKTSTENIVRDFLHPSDFFSLVDGILTAPPVNLAIDCYTRATIDKFSLLSEMQKEFGLNYEIDEYCSIINSTGSKPFYFSKNRVANIFGYEPKLTSLEGILQEAEKILKPKFLV